MQQIVFYVICKIRIYIDEGVKRRNIRFNLQTDAARTKHKNLHNRYKILFWKCVLCFKIRDDSLLHSDETENKLLLLKVYYEICSSSHLNRLLS